MKGGVVAHVRAAAGIVVLAALVAMLCLLSGSARLVGSACGAVRRWGGLEDKEEESCGAGNAG